MKRLNSLATLDDKKWAPKIQRMTHLMILPPTEMTIATHEAHQVRTPKGTVCLVRDQVCHRSTSSSQLLLA